MATSLNLSLGVAIYEWLPQTGAPACEGVTQRRRPVRQLI